MKKIVCLLVSIFLLSNASFVVAKEFKHFDDPEKRQEMFNKMTKELNLTDEQISEMEKLRQENKDKVKQIIIQIREKDKEIDAELVKEKYDSAKVNSLLQEIRNLSADMAQMRIEDKIKIRSILTQEQFKKLSKNKKKEAHNKK